MNLKHVVIVGGGAAGMFTAALCAERIANCSITVLEKTRQLLSKVKISGGGRCNVTHAQFEPKELVRSYPRGYQELLGPFYSFQPKDTMNWFAEHGVALKVEEDGRVFPITDQSQTIIDCLSRVTQENNVEVRLEAPVGQVERLPKGFQVYLKNGEEMYCDSLILATGSSSQGHSIASSLGHQIIPPVPSLFTFHSPTSPLLPLSGISVYDVEVHLNEGFKKQRGALLLTHFGFSGPSILKLSAWAARELAACKYHTSLFINWIPEFNQHLAFERLSSLKGFVPQKTLLKENPFHLPAQLWKQLLIHSNILDTETINSTSMKKLSFLAQKLTKDSYLIEGKTAYKQEFVTCGGISLRQVNCKTMESRLIPNLYFVGEILDIDGITGGFNFQNAWTTGFLATTAIQRALY